MGIINNQLKRLIMSTSAYHLYMLDLLRNANIEPQARKFLYAYRLGHNTNNSLIRVWSILKLRRLRLKYGIEIGLGTKIGKGFYLGHAFNITINPSAIIGNNVNIHKGVLIGAFNRGGEKVRRSLEIRSGLDVMLQL